jgi:hypothetical protein
MCVTDMQNLFELLAVPCRAQLRPETRTISAVCGLQYMITRGLSCDVRTEKGPKKRGFAAQLVTLDAVACDVGGLFL